MDWQRMKAQQRMGGGKGMPNGFEKTTDWERLRLGKTPQPSLLVAVV